MMFTVTKKVSAATLFKDGEIVKSGTCGLDVFEDKSLYSFKYDEDYVYVAYIEAELYQINDTQERSQVKLSLIDCAEEIYDGGKIGTGTLKNENYGMWLYPDENDLQYGKRYKFQIENTGMGRSYRIKYRIERYFGYSQNVKIPSKINLQIGTYKRLYSAVSPYRSLPEVRWKVSNSKVAVVNQLGYITTKSKGTCVVTGTLNDGRRIKSTIYVSTPKKPEINYVSVTFYKGETEKLKILYTNKKVKWSTSNKKIATISANGGLKAVSVGKCTITGKVGGKKYICKVRVIYRDPNFGARLTGYNTRNNYFNVTYHNWGDKPVYINPGNAKVENYDYKSYDRYLRMAGGKTIKINPKKTVNIKFYVRGGVTWYDYTRYTLFYRFSYDGRSFEGHVWNEDSSFKKGKKWYTTYWKSHEILYSWL